MTDYMNKVERQADRQGWHVIGFSKSRHSPGTVPSGVIAFVRNINAPEGVGRCGTARWAYNQTGEYGIMFFSGNYDMSRDDAMEDFIKRTQGFTVGA